MNTRWEYIDVEMYRQNASSCQRSKLCIVFPAAPWQILKLWYSYGFMRPAWDTLDLWQLSYAHLHHVQIVFFRFLFNRTTLALSLACWFLLFIETIGGYNTYGFNYVPEIIWNRILFQVLLTIKLKIKFIYWTCLIYRLSYIYYISLFLYILYIAWR